MAKTRVSKEKSLKNLIELLKNARGVVFTNYSGLTVKDMQELRRALRAQGITFEVTKKTLLTKALTEAGLASITKDKLAGMVSVAVSTTDEVEPAKQVVQFAKTHEKFTVTGGILEATFIDTARVKELARLPSKQQLLAQLVWALSSPLAGFANVLVGNLRGLVQVLRARAQQAPNI